MIKPYYTKRPHEFIKYSYLYWVQFCKSSIWFLHDFSIYVIMYLHLSDIYIYLSNLWSFWKLVELWINFCYCHMYFAHWWFELNYSFSSIAKTHLMKLGCTSHDLHHHFLSTAEVCSCKCVNTFPLVLRQHIFSKEPKLYWITCVKQNKMLIHSW